MANCGRMVRASAMVTMESWRAYRKPASLFRMLPSLNPYDLPFPKNEGSICPNIREWHYISATGDPIHFMFGPKVGFSGTADLMALFTVRTNPRWRPQPCWKNFKWRYLCNRSSDPLHVWLGTADLMALFSIRTNSRWRPPPSWVISNGHISATAHDLLI